MIFTVAAVVVDSEAFVDSKRDIATSIVRDVLGGTARDDGSFEITSTRIVPHSVEEIRSTVKTLVENSFVDWIIVVGGIGFENHACTPEVCQRLCYEDNYMLFMGVFF